MPSSTQIKGFRVYRSTDPEGPYCALLDPGTPNPVLPAGIVGACTSPGVDQDAYSADYSANFISATAVHSYWDRTVANDHVYYYRVSQLELDGTVKETPFQATYQVAGKELGYDKDVLPPPQGFRAWASLKGNLDDKRSMVLNWCPICAPGTSDPRCDPVAPDLPTIQEYKVYRTGRNNLPYKLLARLSTACLDAGTRCEITTTSACVDATWQPKSCNIILPIGTPCNDVSGPRCGVVDRTFTTWPLIDQPAQPDQYFDNYRYFVTAVGQLDTDPQSESKPSFENQGWLNYCSSVTGKTCPSPPCCLDRRDPDGDGEFLDPDGNRNFLVCGDENALLLDQSEPAAPVEDAPTIVSTSSAPYRTIGDPPFCEDCEPEAPPPNPYDPPARFVFYHTDHLGSPRIILNVAGGLEAKHHYLPFGEERPVPSDPTISTRAFTGHERDAETGLDYMFATSVIG